MFDIHVESAFWPEQSEPKNDTYVFVYTIRITNNGEQTAQLISRHWVITDGFGVSREVRGDGVVGMQPHIAPNETFEYSSTCPLPTPYGTMHGEYYCVDEQGGQFIVDIPQFLLVAATVVH
jgi:ApaG protein